MTTLHHVNKSRKKIRESVCGIEGGIPKGSAYYWWKFRRGGKRYSLTPPRRSQLTQSAYYGALYDIADTVGAATADTIVGDIGNVRDSLESLKDDCESNLDNIPEAMKEASVLNERIEWLDNAIQEVSGIQVDDEDDEDAKENAVGELQNVDLGGS